MWWELASDCSASYGQPTATHCLTAAGAQCRQECRIIWRSPGFDRLCTRRRTSGRESRPNFKSGGSRWETKGHAARQPSEYEPFARACTVCGVFPSVIKPCVHNTGLRLADLGWRCGLRLRNSVEKNRLRQVEIGEMSVAYVEPSLLQDPWQTTGPRLASSLQSSSGRRADDAAQPLRLKSIQCSIFKIKLSWLATGSGAGAGGQEARLLRRLCLFCFDDGYGNVPTASRVRLPTQRCFLQ
jgi:hypothetical protein